METRILKLSLVAVLTTGTLYGFGGSKVFDNCDNKENGMLFPQSSHFQNNSMKNMMITLSDMELSSTQWKEIRKVMFDLKERKSENFKQKDSVILIDNDGNFNREEFVKNRTLLSKEMINSQSEVVGKVLSILDNSQKKYLASKLNQ